MGIQVSIQKVPRFEQLLSVLSQVGGGVKGGRCSSSWGCCRKYYFLLGTKRAQAIVVIHKKILLDKFVLAGIIVLIFYDSL